MERYVTTTYRLHGLHICIQGGYVTTTYRLHGLHMCIQGGYVPTTYPKYKLKCYMSINNFRSLLFP